MSVFQSFWHGDSLPAYQRLSMKSFIDYGHEYFLYAYRTFDVPNGVALRDANEILPESQIFFYGDHAGVGRGSIAAFANLFRLHLLNRMGNWWVDTDIVCLSENVPNNEIFMGWEIDDVICNAILKFPARHELVRELCDLAEKMGSDLVWGQNGITLLTRVMWERNLLPLVVPQPQAYPIRSVEALKLLIPEHHDEVSEAIEGKPFLHLCNEIMRRAVVLPWVAPPQGSLIAELCRRHNIDFGSFPAYTSDQIKRLSDNYCAAATWSHDMVQKTELSRLKARLRNK